MENSPGLSAGSEEEGGGGPRETDDSLPKWLKGVSCVSHRRKADFWSSTAYILPSKSNITIINNTNPIPPLG